MMVDHSRPDAQALGDLDFATDPIKADSHDGIRRQSADINVAPTGKVIVRYNNVTQTVTTVKLGSQGFHCNTERTGVECRI
jgi:hypothetical protein